jgi:hypothetical protein
MSNNGLHYHIHWSGKSTLDWECFNTHEEAETSASQLALPGETYTIEEQGLSCPQCMKLIKKIPASDSNEVSS